MSAAAPLEKVLDAIRADLGDPCAWGAPVEIRGSLALCALNSGYSLRATSASVRNVLRRYRVHRLQAGADPAHDSGPDLLQAMDAVGGPRVFSLEVLKTGAAFPKTGRLRAEAIYDAVTGLANLGVATGPQLLEASADRATRWAWQSVKGLGSQSWTYLLMNAGDRNQTKPDTMVQRFLNRATGSTVSENEATRLVNAAAEALGVDIRALDRAIWLFESPDQHHKQS